MSAPLRVSRADGLLHLVLERPLEHDPRARVRHGTRRPDHRRAAVLAPGPRAEVGGAHRREPVRVDGRTALGVDLAGIAQALGDGEHRRQLDLDHLGAVVVLQLEVQAGSQVLEAAHPAGEGTVEQLGQLRAHLAGLPVDRVPAEQDQIERTGGPQRAGERPRRGQRVGPGERGVAEVQARVGAPGDRLAQDVFGAGGAQRQHGAGAAGGAGEGDALGHGAAAVRVHLERDAPAHQPAALEAQRLRQRHLLGQRRDAQRVTGAPGHAGAGTRCPAGRAGTPGRTAPAGTWRGVAS